MKKIVATTIAALVMSLSVAVPASAAGTHVDRSCLVYAYQNDETVWAAMYGTQGACANKLYPSLEKLPNINRHIVEYLCVANVWRFGRDITVVKLAAKFRNPKCYHRFGA